MHAGLFGPDDVVEVDGVVVTSLERTCVDLATARDDLPEALTVFDAALRAGASTEGMERHLRRSKRGVAMARRAYSFADPRAESPGESWSRAQMIDAALPLPDLQVEHLLGSGRLARCDFGVDGVFVGEFDGLVKYRREMRRGEPPEQVVIREKLREDGLRALGLDVGRWIWDDLRAGRLVARLEERYDRIGIRYG
ncbi:hypothetical protein [Gordonia humi]|uniref:Uncharacterized protein n=1 Tax=Gordonia humi TaxID=686429 RepID=A0A840F3M0_9ACTN|nr:hypothetical protein [Gordonia humi]